jgi:GDP-L-fucose synthase
MIRLDNLFKEYEGKKVLICGASGMTGHNLFDLMKMLGAEVHGTCLSRQCYYQDNMPMFEAVDLSQEVECDEFFVDSRYDYVFICCAQTYNAQMCVENPQAMVLPNIQMVGNILRNCLETGVKRVLYVSSATVYQPSYKVMSEEDLDLNADPNQLYMGVGWAKRYMEQMCRFYHELGLECVVVRPTNIYGRYDKTNEKINHVIPALIMRALRKEDPFRVYGNGRAIKNFIHANDFVRDLAKVMAFYKTPDPINLCSDQEVSINEVVDHIIAHVRALDPKYQPQIIHTSQAVDRVPYRALSRKKFDALFGKDEYKPIKAGLKDVIEWFSLSPQTLS